MSRYDDIIKLTNKNKKEEQTSARYNDIVSIVKQIKKGSYVQPKVTFTPTKIEDVYKDNRSNFVKAYGNLGTGVLSGITKIGKALTSYTGMDESDKKLSNIINKKQQQMSLTTSSIKSAGARKAAEITSTIGEMTPALGTAVLTGGTGGAVISGLTSAGGYMSDAESKGASKSDKILYGTLLGIAEGLTDKITFGSAGKAFKAAKTGKITKSLLSAGITAAENAVQEAVMEPIQEATSEIVLGKSDLTGIGERMLNSGINGALVGVILGGASSGMGKAIDITNKVANGGTVTKAEIQQAAQEAQKNNVEPIQINTGVQAPTTQNKTVLSQGSEITQPSAESSIKGTEQANMTIKDKSLNIAQETTRDTQDIVKDIPTKLTNPKKVKAVTSDFYRNMRDSFDKSIADRITGNFDKAKLANVNMQNELANDLKTNIVDRLGIKKGSEESALVQRYGEKEITLEELKTLSPNKWQNIVEADKYFRNKYNELIDYINEVRKTIYPNVEAQVIALEEANQKISEKIKTKKQELANTKSDTKKYSNLQAQIDNLILKFNSNDNMLKSDELLRQKRVLKREDYYRHFQEEGEKFSDIFSSAKSDIDPKLVGISAFTKPNAKWSSIATRRTENKTKYDAVGGFLNYIPQASFMMNIDPQINNLRTITKELRTQMSDQQDNTAANELILHLDKLTNKLAGKQTDSDRVLIDLFRRDRIKVAKKIVGRIKSNLILGNVGSAVSQVLNMPQIIGKVKNPSDLANGLIDTIKGADYSQSQFINERYKSDIASQFDTKLIDQPKKLALWMVGALDEVTTKAGWNAFYRQAVRKGIDNPIQYADNLTREMVGGRGLGEKTIAQESFAVQTLAPFTVEVGNTMRVYKDMLKEKDFVGLFITIIASYLLNKGLEEIRGTGGALDILGAVEDALDEEDTSVLQKGGRIAGELLSNTPGGQLIAGLIPETDTYFGETKVLPKRSDLFGKNDPTRYGTGSMFQSAIKNPITTIVTPYGGKQIQKTIEGLKMFEKPTSGSYTNKGQLRFPVEDTTGKKIQAALFGQYASKEAVKYFKENKLPYSEKITKFFNDNSNNGISSKETINIMKELKNIDDKPVITQKDIDNMKKIDPNTAKGMKLTQSKTKQKLDYIQNSNFTDTQKTTMIDYILSKEQKEKISTISTETELNKEQATQFFVDNYGANEYQEYKNIMKLDVDNSKKNKLLAMSTTSETPVTAEEIAQIDEVSYETFAKLDLDGRKKYIKLANAGIDQEELVKYYKGKGKIKGIKGRNGRTISGSKKAAMIKFVQTLSLTREEKIYLLEQAGYKMR